MTDLSNKVHHQFKLNQVGYTEEELREVAYSLVKEGNPFEISIGDFLLDWLSNSPALEVRTSGTSGTAKVINLQKDHMINSARATGNFLKLSPGNKALLCLPVEYIAGKMMLVRAMVLGLDLHYQQPSSTPLNVTHVKYDFGAMTPMQMSNSLQNIEMIAKLIVGGAPVSDDLRKEVSHKSNEVYETYGMTETITHIALKKLSRHSKENSFKTLKGVSVSKDDQSCLIINAPEITSQTVITKDVVDLISDTEFIWLGRMDNVVNSGGIKLLPEQIENKLKPHIISRIFTIGLPDDRLGQKLALVVEGDVDVQAIRNKINSLKSLEKFEIPKTILTVPKFLETKSGKILRAETTALAQT